MDINIEYGGTIYFVSQYVAYMFLKSNLELKIVSKIVSSLHIVFFNVMIGGKSTNYAIDHLCSEIFQTATIDISLICQFWTGI